MEMLILGRFLTLLGRDSLEAGVMVLAVLLAQWLLGKRLSPRWRSALWLLVMLRMLLVVSVGSVVSVFNLLPHTEAGKIQKAAASAPAAIYDRLPITGYPDVPLTVRAGAGAESHAVTAPPAETGGSQTTTAAVSTTTRSQPPMTAAQRTSRPVDWSRILFLTWLVGAGGLAVYVLVGSIRVGRRISRLARVTDQHLTALLADCTARLRVRERLDVVEDARITTPALHGFFRPRLVLPAGFTERFSEQELRFILLHELAHVKRRDILLNWLAAGLQVVHWFNPLIWFGFARWRADRELACDALALEAAGGNQNQAYGRTILRLLENFTPRTAMPGLVGILEDKKQLRERIKMIAGFRAGRRLGLVTAVLLAGLGIVCLTDAQNKNSVSVESTSSSSTSQSAPQAEASSRPAVTNGPVMKVTVLDDATGLPLEDAEVFAPNESSFFGGHENAPRWLTDKSGIAKIHLGESPSNSVWQLTWFTLSARKEGYGAAGRSWSDGSKDVRPGLPKEITLRLKHGTTAGGVVVDEAGVAQSGIQVRVFGSGYSYERFQEQNQSYSEFWNDSAGSMLPVTDAAGRWQVKDFPTDLPNVAIEFIRQDSSVEKFRISTGGGQYERAAG